MLQNLTRIIEQVSKEKSIPKAVIVEAVEAAMLTAARKKYGHEREIEARFNEEVGEVELFQFRTVVEAVTNELAEVSVDEAAKLDPEAQIGDSIGEKLDNSFLGRIAAQTAKQVIIQKVRDAERDIIYNDYKNRVGELVTGIIRRVEKGNVIVDLGRAEAVIPPREQVRVEEYRPGERIQAYFLSLQKTTRGPSLILSRRNPNLLMKLFEMEVPEVSERIVEIKNAAREPGARSKIAVYSRDSDVDPVGACVGMKGSRVQNVVQELRGEKIDIVCWDPDPAKFVCNAISPAEVAKVIINEKDKSMEIIVPDDQLSLAIGREGQNARLAAKLTGWRIDIKSLTESAADTIKRMRATMEIVDKLLAQVEQAELTLAKKAESKPINPEEYTNLSKLVDTFEKMQNQGRQASRAEKAEKAAAIRATINPATYTIKLQTAGLPDRVTNLLLEADYENVGKVMEQLAIGEDRLLALDGFGPKMLEELKAALVNVKLPEAAAPAPAPEAQAAAAAPTGDEAAPAEPVAAVPAGEPGAELAVPAPVAEGAEPVQSLEEIIGDTEEDDDKPGGKKKGKKKGKDATREVTFDDELGVFVTKKKRKPGRLKDWTDLEP